MKVGILYVFAALVVCAVASKLPNSFVPLPPIYQQAPVTVKPKATKLTQAPKLTKPPVTKKPTTTKGPATFPKQTVAPSLPPSTPASLPPSKAAPTQNTKANCGLNINIPKSNCNGGNSAVQQTLNTLRQELDKTRQQHQAQNIAVQAMISRLQGQQTGYLNKIADLQNEVRNLVSAFNSLSCSSPSSTPTSTPTPGTTPAAITMAPTVTTPGLNLVLQQAVQNVRSDMNQNVIDLNNKLFNLTFQMQNNQLQESKVNQGIESQIQSQSSNVARLLQQVNDLNRQLQQLNTSTGNGNGATSADIAKLQAQIKKVENDIQKFDQNQQTKINSLNTRANSLQLTVGNNTNDISSIKANTALTQTRLTKMESDITLVHDALALFRQTSAPRMRALEADVKSLQRNLTGLQSSIGNVGRSVLNLVIKSGKDKQTLNGLQAQTASLKTTVGSIQTNLAKQSIEIGAINSGLINLKNAIPIADLNKMNNIVLSIINSGSKPTPQQYQDLTKSLTSVINNLQKITLSTTQSPSG